MTYAIAIILLALAAWFALTRKPARGRVVAPNPPGFLSTDAPELPLFQAPFVEPEVAATPAPDILAALLYPQLDLQAAARAAAMQQQITMSTMAQQAQQQGQQWGIYGGGIYSTYNHFMLCVGLWGGHQ